MVDQSQLTGERVDLSGHTLHALAGFSGNQFKLGVEFAKARSHAIGAAQETGTLNGRCWVCRQGARYGKEVVKRGAQANALVTHDVHHALGVIDHGFLAGQVAGAVA